MAATKRNRAFEQDVRERIQTRQLVNVLQNNSLGKLKQELSASRLKSIEILLRKVIPDLSSVEQNTDINVNVEYYVSAKPLSAIDWQATYGPKQIEGTNSSLVPAKRTTNGAH